MLNELWTIVYALFGNGNSEGLLTAGLLGFFGCLCFMLSANANEFDKVVDEGKDRRARVLALIAPAALLLLYALYVISPVNTRPAGVIITGLLSISPALFAGYFSMKHLLLPEDGMGFLKCTKRIDIAALVFYAANYLYPSLYLYFSDTVLSIYDLFLAVLELVMILLCRKGALRWKTLI